MPLHGNSENFFAVLDKEFSFIKILYPSKQRLVIAPFSINFGS